MKKLLPITLIYILFTGSFTSCKKNNNGDPPVLPPQESMTIDFSNFSSGKKSGDVIFDQKGTENSNWEFSATAAGVWKLLITTTLVIPVTSFKLAIDQNPAFLSDKTWQWSYNVSVANVVYKARLTGQISTSDVLWKMYITNEGTGGFAEFLWFNGTSRIDGTSGQWILNQSSLLPGAILQIDWTKTGNSIGSVTYTYVKNDTFKNSYIKYGLTSNTLSAYYTIHYYNGVKFSDVNVEWDPILKNGRVKSVDYLGDDSWYCWDANKINIICQ